MNDTDYVIAYIGGRDNPNRIALKMERKLAEYCGHEYDEDDPVMDGSYYAFRKWEREFDQS